jgi:glutathione S-transferase
MTQIPEARMSDMVTLHGYRFSVYNRVARMVLHEKSVAYARVEVDPFAEPDPAYLDLHPFGRVPALTHDGFSVFETSAISRYIDDAFDGPSLQPEGLKALTRMNQTIAVIDNYGYWPMVRQVFSQRVFSPLLGENSDESAIAAGLEASQTVLAVLDGFAQEGHVLNGATTTLADCHLAPMMDYFVRANEGREALERYPALSKWWKHAAAADMVRTTDPDLPRPGDPQTRI